MRYLLALSALLLILTATSVSAGARPAPIVHDDLSLAGITLGDAQQHVKQRLGPPAQTSILHGVGLPIWQYPRQGIEIIFSLTEQPTIVGIHAGKNFTGQTHRGIKIGAPLSAVHQAYGGKRAATNDGYIEFQAQDGLVNQIIIRRPWL